MNRLISILLMTLLLLAFSNSKVAAQVNYVLNGDFEDTVFCPYEWDQVYAARHWTSLDTTNTRLRPGAPDFMNKCADESNSFTTVPNNGSFFQAPHSGAGIMNFQAFYDESYPPAFPFSRDYLQGRLQARLTAGKSYCVKFYVVLVEASGYAIQDIGACLENGRIDTTVNYGFPQIKYTPQVRHTGGVISDTMNWTKIEGAFTATGSERFITIGNFKSKAATTYISIGPNEYSWYLIDDVSVIESDLKADAGPNRAIGRGDSTYIGRPAEVGLECTWTVLGSSTVISTGAGLWVKPQTTTEYVVTQTLCGNVKKDTVWVGVWNVGVGNVSGIAQSYSLSPNPSSGRVQLSQAFADERPVGIQVVEATGRVVYAAIVSFSGRKAMLDLSGLAAGCYFVQMRDADGSAVSLQLLKQ